MNHDLLFTATSNHSNNMTTTRSEVETIYKIRMFDPDPSSTQQVLAFFAPNITIILRRFFVFKLQPSEIGVGSFHRENIAQTRINKVNRIATRNSGNTCQVGTWEKADFRDFLFELQASVAFPGQHLPEFNFSFAATGN